MRLLVIEDDPSTAQILDLMLKSEGFKVQTTDLGEEGVDLAKLYDFDAITLDLNLPDISGLDVLRQIRVAKVATPILILTGDQSIETKVKTLGGGADDYMTKPFHKDELIARIQAVVRRSKGHPESIIHAGPIAVRLDRKVVEVSGKPVHLTGKEYQLLELLALRKGQTLTKEHFLNHLYGGMDEPEIKIVDVFICKLRAKLRKAGADGYVQTVWGRGYALTDEVLKTAPEPLEARPFAVLALIAEKPRTFAELATATRMEFSTLRRHLSGLIAEQLARNVGLPNAAVYVATGRGRERLKAVSGQMEAA